MHNLLLAFGVAPECGSSGNQMEHECRPSVVRVRGPRGASVLVPGESADYGRRRSTWTTIKWSHVSPIEAHGSCSQLPCLIAKNAKLRNWNWDWNWNWNLGLWATRVYYINMNNLFTWSAETRCCCCFRSNHMIVTSINGQELLVVCHSVMRLSR